MCVGGATLELHSLLFLGAILGAFAGPPGCYRSTSGQASWQSKRDRERERERDLDKMCVRESRGQPKKAPPPNTKALGAMRLGSL